MQSHFHVLKKKCSECIGAFPSYRFCISTSLLFQAHVEVGKALEVQVAPVAKADKVQNSPFQH